MKVLLHSFNKVVREEYGMNLEEELNPDCIAVTVKHSLSKMFWECFSWNGLGPIVPIKGSVTGQIIHETEIISISAISEVEIVEIISVLSLKRSDCRN
jgi:hypothetical protein